MPPLIAIPGHVSPEATGFRTPIVGAGTNYLDALARAGAVPLIVVPGTDTDAVLARVDGLLLLGGGDVDPALYGADPHPATALVDTELDAFEIDAVQRAIERELPVLAVCRGAQVLNVARGGTLLQHVPDVTDAPHRRDEHAVAIEPGTRAASVLGVERAIVSSRHHQAVDRLGDGLVVSARSDDGVVEAIELDHGWVLGLQWHPEDTAASDPVQQAAFDGLARAAGG
jgi:putative glutamine amidotransferase